MTIVRKIIVLTVLWLASLGPLHAANTPLTVVELYTSQGCSSCPPADAYLGELAKRDDILALSFHVDYWDYIGWKDPFADSKYTARQRAFSVIFAQRYVYTPQMVVHGSYQVVGSDPGVIEEAIGKAKKMPDIAVSLIHQNGAFEVTLPETTIEKDINVIAVFFDKKHETRVARGENAGRELANYNVVRDFVELLRWKGDARTVSFENHDAKGRRCAILLQSAQSGKILGAAQLTNTTN